NDVQTGEQGQTLVEHGAHDMTVASVAKELQGQQRPHRTRGRDHLGSRESGLREELVQPGGSQPWEEQKQPTELGAKATGLQVESADISRFGRHGSRIVGPLVIASSRQLGKPLLFEDRGDHRWAERLAVAGDGAADVVDGEILLPQRDDLFTKPLLLAWRSAFACGGEEKVPLVLLAKLMDKDTKAARSIAEPLGRFGRRDTLDEESAQRLVLSMVGVGWLQELTGQR